MLDSATQSARALLRRLDDPDALMQWVVDDLAAITGARRVSLLLRDIDPDSLSLAAGRGLRDGIIGKVRSLVSSGFAGRVVARGRPIAGYGDAGGVREYGGAAYVVLPLGLPGACHGAACLTDLPGDQLPDGDTLQRWTRRGHDAGLALGAALRLARAEAESSRDTLTQLPNRRAFERALARESERAQRTGAALAIGIVDVDHFKRVNDRYGHDVGDRVLTQIASRLREALRETDLVARWGGEEFAILLPDLPRPAQGEAWAVVERARAMLAARPLSIGSGLAPLTITISGGVAVHPGRAGEVGLLLRRANQALLQAKSGGRNRILATSEEPMPRADQR